MIRVMVVDDHQVVREGLRQLICGEPDMDVTGEAGSVAEMWEILGPDRCDVIVLDVSLPDRSGLDALRDLRASYPRLPVIILSIYPESQYAARALKEGAAVYICKDGPVERVVEAIREAVAS